MATANLKVQAKTGMQPILEAMSQHSNNEAVQEAGCLALRSMCALPRPAARSPLPPQPPAAMRA